MNEQKKARNSERSHSKPWRTDQAKQQKTVNSVSEEEPRDSRHHSKGRVRETIAMTGLAAKTGTIANTAIRRAEEKKGAEERKFHYVISMAKTKAIGPMNAPSP